MIDHAHEWTEVDGGYACTQCEETSPVCVNGGHPTETALLICRRCEARAKRLLDDIEHAAGLYVGGRVDGVILRGRHDGELDETPTVEDALSSWAARWWEWEPGDTDGVYEYLRSRILWAANNADLSGWRGFWRALLRLRHRARAEAGLLPQIQAEPCVYCGGRVARDWADESWTPLPGGLSDSARCLDCATVWPSVGRWAFATREHIATAAETAPDLAVTIEDARAIWPDLPKTTVASWVSRGELVEAGAYLGRALYRLGDLADLVRRRSDETRRGRRAAETASVCVH